MIPESFVSGIGRYIPAVSIAVVYHWIKGQPLKIKITKPRNSKLGDFRMRSKHAIPEISVNGNLNHYSFLVTLTHEIAHLNDYMERKTLREPHGENWKRIYSNLMIELHAAGAFPQSIDKAIIKHIRSPKAASCSDVELNEALRQFDEVDTLLLKDLEFGAHFILKSGRQFIKGELQRTRFKCQDTENKRWYLVSSQAEVHKIS
ncbi:MAG: SprT-like domain-containing protein [Salibacteraceae bacterium]|jgi:SprT protein|nr:SprT-like domain-containing protein [Salibacteraceae bacterium]MDP4763499.1 SprT-like domain-containing protein [Salibacteraceae bacterium]MDP4963503.1 SprT-like domain-containing protein [Salibacteraceae bacterium]